MGQNNSIKGEYRYLPDFVTHAALTSRTINIYIKYSGCGITLAR